MNRVMITLAFTLATIYCQAQSLCEKLAALKKQCYGFNPLSLNDKQQQEKSADLDKFWNLAKTDPDAALPCLKDMVTNENNDPYFCFDASTLILSLDKKQQYLDVVLDGVKKADLQQLQLESYLQVCYFLARNGKDISIPAERLISTPGLHVYLTIHVIDLSAIDASIFLYNAMPAGQAERCLINTVMNGNATGKHNAAVVLNLLCTNKGDSLLNRLMADNKLPDSTRLFILKDRKAFTSNKTSQTSKNEATIRAERQETIKGLSDEGLQRFFALTGELMTIRSKSQLH